MTVSDIGAPGHELVPHRAVLDAAEHILVIARGRPYGPEQAFHELLGVAVDHRIEVLTLARALIDVSEPHRTVAADTAHTIAAAEWGNLVYLPTTSTAAVDAAANDTTEDDSHRTARSPAEPECLLESEEAGRFVFLSLGLTIGAILGVFAGSWVVLLAIGLGYGVRAAVTTARKLVIASRRNQWADAQTPAPASGRERSRPHAIPA